MREQHAWQNRAQEAHLTVSAPFRTVPGTSFEASYTWYPAILVALSTASAPFCALRPTIEAALCDRKWASCALPRIGSVMRSAACPGEKPCGRTQVLLTTSGFGAVERFRAVGGGGKSGGCAFAAAYPCCLLGSGRYASRCALRGKKRKSGTS